MERKDFEVRTNIKFLVKLGWKGTEIIQALQTVYKDDSPKKTCVYKWIERFRDGREAVEDDEGRGRPTISKNNEKIDFVRNLVKEDGRLTVYQIAETVGISVGSMVQLIRFCMTIYASASFRRVGCQKRCAQISSISEVNCQRRFCSKLKQMKTAFLIESSQEMKHGSTSTILKQNSSPNSGSHVDHLAQSNSSLRGLSRR